MLPWLLLHQVVARQLCAMARVSQWANGYLEKEGLARLTIAILVVTTAGCLAYTWGYAEVRPHSMHTGCNHIQH